MEPTKAAAIAKFYCSRGNRIRGPFTTSELRRLAANGQLRRDDIVWKHGSVKKFLASEIVGLHFPQDDRVANAPGLDPAPPLIRITAEPEVFRRGWCLLHGYRIITVDNHELATATAILRPRLTEAECDGTALRKRIQSMFRARVIALAEVSHARFHGRVTKSFSGEPRPASLINLKLKTRTGPVHFRIHRRDVPSIYSALQRTLESRFDPNIEWLYRGPGILGSLVILLLSSIGFATLGAWILSLGSNDESLAKILGTIFLMIAGPLAALSLVRKIMSCDYTGKLPFECLRAYRWPTFDIKNQQGQPIRSRLCGYGLKMLAAIWCYAVLVYLPTRASQISQEYIVHAWGVSIFFLLIPAVPLLYLGHGLISAARTPANTNDSRQAIIYLRSFAFDGRTTLQPDSPLAACLGISGIGSLSAWLSQTLNGFGLLVNWKIIQLAHPIRLLRAFFGIMADSTEQSVVKYFETFGPVQALGQPGERIATAGAMREYTAHDEWQPKVIDYLRKCQAVIVQPSQSASVVWEINAVFNNVPQEAVLFIFPVVEGMANDFEEVRSVLEPRLATRFPRSLPYRGAPAAMWFDRGGAVRWTEISYHSPLRWLFSGNAVNLEYSLRPFVQGMHGGKRELPRPIRAVKWYQTVAAWGLVVVLFWSFGLVLNSAYPTMTMLPFSRSSFRSYEGRTVPYALLVPESWSPRVVDGNMEEYGFSKFGVGIIKVISHPGREDLSSLAEQLVNGTKQRANILVTDVRVESINQKIIDERNCIVIHIKNKYVGGGTETQHVIAYSGLEGTFLVNVVAADGLSLAQQGEVHSILNSVRFTRTVAKSRELACSDAVESYLRASDAEVALIRGKALPYSMRVPKSWSAVSIEQTGIEYAYRTADGNVLIVAAQLEPSDLASLTAEFEQGIQASCNGQAQVIARGTVEIADVRFAELRLSIPSDDGSVIESRSLIYSGPQGAAVFSLNCTAGDQAQIDAAVMNAVVESIRISSH